MKKYPFNATKHAHDIEYRRNRCFNEMHDIAEDEESPNYKNWALYDKLEDLHGELTDLLLEVMGGGIVYLEGKKYGLAHECVLWAAEHRASAMRRV